MRTAALFTVPLLLAGVTVHRVDEYLEAATILVSSNSVRLDLRLAPGIAVASTVLDSIDTDGDGSFSAAEQESYARRVRDDLRLEVDGEPVTLGEMSHAYPRIDQLRAGTGEILLAFQGPLPAGANQRHLVFENRHRPDISAYLANGLVPDDPAIHVTSQTRNYLQSVYQLTYQQLTPGPGSLSFGLLFKWLLGLAVVAALILDRLLAPTPRKAA